MRFSYDAIDIFSGCGGVSCGLTQAGFKVRAAVEIEDSIASTYLAYPPLSKVNVLHGHEHGDICKLSGEEILKAAHIDKDSIYLFAGCPPCQNFSRQNRENKHKTDEERKRLLFEYLRVILEILPPFVLMENVQGITTQMNKEILSEFLAKLRGKYVVACDVLNAADYGVPQLRHRFVLHAVRKDIAEELAQDGIQVSLPAPTHSASGGNGLARWRTVREAIGDLPPIKAGETYPDDGVIHNHKCCSLDPINQRRIRSIRRHGGSRSGLPKSLVLDCHRKLDGKTQGGYKDVYGIMDADKPSPTMTGGCLFYSKGRFGHYEQDRAISIREAARLQTFPDDFIFGDSMVGAALQIGNAVPIGLVKASGNSIRAMMYHIKQKRSLAKRNAGR